MIEARELTKRYGDSTAVHSLSFTIAPGTVTGFLGPNGAGKSTTMRMIMGLDRPASGTVTVNGKPYRQHRAPLREVGALLGERRDAHPRRAAHTGAPWPPPTTSTVRLGRDWGSARSRLWTGWGLPRVHDRHSPKNCPDAVDGQVIGSLSLGPWIPSVLTP